MTTDQQLKLALHFLSNRTIATTSKNLPKRLKYENPVVGFTEVEAVLSMVLEGTFKAFYDEKREVCNDPKWKSSDEFLN